MPKNIPALKSVADFLFNQPLYTVFTITPEQASELYHRAFRLVERPTTDAYCPTCKQPATFEIDGVGLTADTDLTSRFHFDEATVTCTRNKKHKMRFFLLLQKFHIVKVGQYPSLADIANSEARFKYQRVLKGGDWSELYKAATI